MKPEQEPKYNVNEQGQIFNRKSKEVILNDEPVFILRAKDKNAALAIAYYKNLCRNADLEKLVNERLHQFVAFAHEHPDLMKEPD